jgi:ATP:corrinoid adenosyltransferase
MLKAKEYAAELLQIPIENKEEIMIALGNAGKNFLNEFIQLRQLRKISTEEELLNLIHELNKKFERFAKLVNEKHKDLVVLDGFLTLLEYVSPETVKFYNKNKQFLI